MKGGLSEAHCSQGQGLLDRRVQNEYAKTLQR